MAVAGAGAAWSAVTDSSSDAPNNVIVDEAQLAKSQDLAIEGFEGRFPAGYSLPDLGDETDRLTAQAGGKLGLSEGYAESLVVTAWMCARQDAYLTGHAHGDEAALTEASAPLATFYDLEWAIKHFEDPDRNWYTSVVEPALKGDLDLMRTQVEQCAPLLGG